MKSVLRWCVVPMLAASLSAQTAAPAKPKKAKVAATTVSAADVQELKNALAAQQRQIEQLKQQLAQHEQSWQQTSQAAQQAQQQLQQAQAAAADAQQKAAAAATAADAQKDSVSKLSSDMADVKTTLTNTAVNTQEEQKRMSALEGLVGRFRFNGDIRVRGETFVQDKTQDRNRARIRVRFGFDGKLNEDFTGGIYLATGTLGDPTSTNTTLTNFFDKHTIGLDRGFIAYHPAAYKWLTVTGGKFAYTWQRTSVTFDPDLNPEGFTEKFSFDTHLGPVKNVTGQLIQLLFNESGGGQDSYALGGQLSATLRYKRWTGTPSFLSLKWNRPDSILQASAFAVQATTTGSSSVTTPVPSIPTPGEGPGCGKALNAPAFAPCVFAPNGMTNATFVDAKGNLHFHSGFNYADFILNNTFNTGIPRLPVNLLLEFEQNLDAFDHPLDSTGALATNLGSQNKEYGFDFSVGQTKNKNDVQLGYAWLRQEQDSVIASFNESDQRAPTNILQNRIYALWKLRPNTVASFTYWRGRTLNTNLENAVKASGVKTGQTEPNLNRLQFDLIYSF
ncbi:MAG: putative porin [Acidobacteriia bacterium]|nr:putative porin [Terriglobia bacterium]